MLPLEKVAIKRVRAKGNTLESKADVPVVSMKDERTRHIRQFRGSLSRGAWEVGMTIFVHSIVVALHGFAWYPAWLVVQGLCLIRWFMIFHDCGHGSFFPSNPANKYLLWATSWVVWTPVMWTTTHRLHHANHGNLDGSFRWSDTILFTKKQFEAAATSVQLAYRFFRHKLFFFTVAPVANWCIKHRLPINSKHHTALDNMLNTAGVAAILLALRAAYGTSFMLDWMYGILVGACFGFILFHAQHSFEEGYARRQKQWSFEDAAFKGSSFIQIPWFLKWFFMGIEYHHIHHYDTKVPGYLLRECHESGDPAFWQDVTKIGYGDWAGVLSTTMYDEDNQRYI